jgi:hypothetical protein
MYKHLFPLLLPVAALSLTGCCGSRKIPVTGNPIPDVTTVDSVFKIVDHDYKVAKEYLGVDNAIELCSASVTFDASVTKTIDGSLTVLVVTGGYTQSWNHETSITYDLGKPDVDKTLAKPGLTDDLQRAIVKAAEGFNKIPAVPVAGLVKKTFTVEIDFVVTRTGTLGLSLFTDALKATGTLEKDVTQKLSLTFALPGQCPK